MPVGTQYWRTQSDWDMNMGATLDRLRRFARLGWGLLLGFAPLVAGAAGALTWHPAENRLDADVRDQPLAQVLEEVAAATGWQVYLEPGTESIASSKFKNLPVTEGLRRLLGDANFALVPETNGHPRLFVFKTSLREATKLIAAGGTKTGKTVKPIPDELVVRLKHGAKIDDLARQLHAKVIGHLDSLDAYLLKFDSADAAQAARATLAANPDVAAVDSNYPIDRPQLPQNLLAASAAPVSLQVKAPPSTGRIVVGLVDTPVQPLGGGLDAFLLPAVSVVGSATPDPSVPTHGTSMAETLLRSLQNVTGGSSSVQVLPVDVYGNSPSTTTFDVALGIASAVNAGANPINLSLGSPADNPFLHEVIQQASQQGVVFFAAAGNQPVTTPEYPAAYPEVTAVTAGDAPGQIASYANRGDFVKLMAPGSSIIYYQNQPYFVMGTSAASAYASGLAAGLAETSDKGLPAVQAALLNSPALRPPLP